MPFIMPDGSRLSAVLDRAEPARRGKRGSRSGKLANKGASKQPYKHRLDSLFEPKDEYEAAELAAASKLGARSKLRCAPELLLGSEHASNLASQPH